MAPARIELLDERACQLLDAELVERVHEFNVCATGHGGGRLVGGSVRTEGGELLAGFSGHTWGGVCVIAHLWVAEHLRGTGLGHALLKSAEGEAAKRQCACVILATHSFQAPGFYEAQGYEKLGGVDDWPIGHSNIFYRKALASRHRGPVGFKRPVEEAVAVPHDCRPARQEDFPAIGRMLELYQYELSDIWEQELDSLGQFGYDTSGHQQARRSFAHVLLVGERYAGFALVAPAKVTRDEGWWMEQFFVLKRYRKAGRGLALANHVFQSHPGCWEVGQMPGNAAAREFWRRAVAIAAKGNFTEVEITHGGWQGTVQRFTIDAAA